MTRHGEWVAYVGPISFPWGQAGSRRVYGMAGSLAAAGRDVVVVSGGTGAPMSRLDEVDGPGSVSYLGLGEELSGRARSLAGSVQVFLHRGRRTVQWLDAQPTKPSHVLVYGGGAQYMVQLQRWCGRHGVPLVPDIVEWYSLSQMGAAVIAPAHLSAKVALRYHYPRCDGIIAISSFLAEHYRGRGNRVLRVPPTLDVRNTPFVEPAERDDRFDITLVYAGVPGRKDLLATIIRAVDRVDSKGVRVQLRVLGPDRRQVRALLDGDPIPPSTRVLGRLSQQEVPVAVRQADFSVLLRRPARFSQAGFPTKFCESLANGTPVITNLTSDLGEHLSDGDEGLVCRDHSIESLTDTLLTAARISRPERNRMRRAARARALRAFDFRAWAEPLATFLDAVR